MKRRSVILTLAAIVGAGLLLLVVVSLAPVVQWDRWDNVQIRGRLVDSTSGSPQAGVRIMSLQRPEDAHDEAHVRWGQSWAQKQLDMFAEARGGGHDTAGYCPGPNGMTTSDDQGQFMLCVRVRYGGTDWGWFLGSKPHEPPPFNGVKALLLQWPDGRRAVIDTTDGKWTVVGRRDLHAKLDMGTLRVAAP